MIVYKATNSKNNKVYIGATTLSLEQRIERHNRDAHRDDRCKGRFQNAIVQYGIESFHFEQIDSANTKEEMYAKEQYWIKYYNSTDELKGYNLDSGGLYCKKHEETKRKIGDTTIRKWNDPNISAKMRDGLEKATKVWQEICESKRVRFECPVCGKVIYLPPWECKSKTFCSVQCASTDKEMSEKRIEASKKGAQVTHLKNLELKSEIAKLIIEWAKNNKDYMCKCKLNKVTSHLKPLIDIIKAKYGIFDLRSLYVCLDVSSKKEFALKLINIVSEENVC